MGGPQEESNPGLRNNKPKRQRSKVSNIKIIEINKAQERSFNCFVVSAYFFPLNDELNTDTDNTFTINNYQSQEADVKLINIGLIFNITVKYD